MEQAWSGLPRGWFLSNLRRASTLAGGQADSFLHAFNRDFTHPVEKDGREHVEYVPDVAPGLTELRAQSELTCEQVAERMGVLPAVVEWLETGDDPDL